MSWQYIKYQKHVKFLVFVYASKKRDNQNRVRWTEWRCVEYASNKSRGRLLHSSDEIDVHTTKYQS